jgi:hypothetical protein
MRSTVRRTALLAGLALAVAGGTLTPTATAGPPDHGAASAKPRAVDVRGRQIPVDVDAGKYRMEGDLVGEWLYLPQTPPLHQSDTLYVEAGLEVFTGCIDRNRDRRCGNGDVRGELRTAFLYWSSFDLDGDLIKGQCVHPVTGGRGAFAGARGRLDMVDRPVRNGVRTTYWGTIVLNAVPSEGPAPDLAGAGASTELRTSATPLRRGC